MRDSFDITTIIFAILAVVVVWKLRSVLGTRTGTERPPFDPFRSRRTAADTVDKGPVAADDGKVIRLPGAANDVGPSGPAAAPAAADVDRWKGVAEPGSKVAAGLDAIQQADTSFDVGRFVEGCKAAYEMIVTAFAVGDRKILRPLLSKDVFDSFSGAIGERETRGEKIESTFVSIDGAQLEDAQLRGGNAQISVRFLSKLITATRDKAGAVIDGDAEAVVDMVDIWTFARETTSRDPNWKLVATETAH